MNPAGRRLLGLGSGQHQGADYGDVLSHAVARGGADRAMPQSGHPPSGVDRMPAARAGTLKLGASVSPLFGESSEVQGAICLFTDLTAVVALEEQLRLKDSLARVGELTAGIAHEFRNGLATIHGYSRLLDLDALPPAFRTYVEGIPPRPKPCGRWSRTSSLRAPDAAHALAGGPPGSRPRAASIAGGRADLHEDIS